jgi:endothelin-converting enzyme
VHNIVQKIGYPTKSPDILDPSVLQSYYQTVNVTSSTFFDNVLSVISFESRKMWSQLGKPTDRNEWGMTTPTVNAYYNPAGNEIVFPAGIMQFPVFGAELPEYVNYGAFGAVSGHELSHGKFFNFIYNYLWLYKNIFESQARWWQICNTRQP